MGRTVTQTSSNPDLTFEQVTTGDTPQSIELSINAKGQAQFSIQCRYSEVTDMRLCVADDLDRLIAQVKEALAKHNIPLAGQA